EPEYGRHGLPGLAMRRLEMIYLIRWSPEALSASASLPASTPLAGSWVMSIAVTTPTEPSVTHGLWSDVRAACAASPILPSLALLRFGASASIWARRVSNDLATRQVIGSFSDVGSCGFR